MMENAFTLWISDKDILSGRGHTVYMHPGNQELRRLARARWAAYAEDSTADEKLRLVELIYDGLLKKGYRFLGPKTKPSIQGRRKARRSSLHRIKYAVDTWPIMTKECALTKIRQSLVDAKKQASAMPPEKSALASEELVNAHEDPAWNELVDFAMFWL